jgi:hypothetical protein
MTTPDAKFESELEVFRREEEEAIQFFYAYLALHAVAADHEEVHRVLNSAALFWNTTLGALQAATFMTLGRIFDQQSPHNLDRLLRIAQDYPEIFSRNSLAARRQGRTEPSPEWVDEFALHAYVPTSADFRRLKTHVRKRRKIYESNYRELRHKVFAHRALTDQAAISALYARTNIRELQRLVTFLSSLYEALWQLFFNGRKPTLRPQRYSLKRIRDLPSPTVRRRGVQERIAHEIESFLVAAAGASQQVPAVDTPMPARR